MAEQLDKHNVSKPKSHFLPRPGSVKRRYRAIQSQVSQASINQIEDIVPSGLLAVFKPQNWTSFDVVAKIKGVLQGELQGKYGIKATKLKVGHGGTLDPMATGVLVLGIGAGTKYMSDYLAGPKAYIASAALGTETNTLDSTGKVTGTAPSGHVTADMIELLMQKEYIGDIKQIPPMFSALKQNGKRLYDLARNDVEVSREPRDVTVYDLQLLSFTESEGKVPSTSCKSFEFYVSCSGGFYVRSLISDLGRACGSAAHMTSLERTQQGPFSLKDCLRQENWTFDEIKNTLVQHNALSKFGKIKSKHVP
jgi:tRNA pseudouridine55 synthase